MRRVCIFPYARPGKTNSFLAGGPKGMGICRGTLQISVFACFIFKFPSQELQ